MLTGMLEMTDGKVDVLNYDLKNDLNEIRQFTGVCPQHDILFPNLTVLEHLQLFAVFKGMKN